MNITIGLIFLIIVLFFILTSAVKILMEYERGVIFRLGRYSRTGGPGLTLIIPFIEQMRRVDLRLVTMDVPPQDVITRDNVSVKVSAVVYFRVHQARRCGDQCGRLSLRDLTARANDAAQRIGASRDGRVAVGARQDQRGVADHPGPTNRKLGDQGANVEVKHVDLPQEMQRAMARQAEAERERRAKVINAEGEFQAATRLAEAAADHRCPSPGPATAILADLSRSGQRKTTPPSCSPSPSICSRPSCAATSRPSATVGTASRRGERRSLAIGGIA